MFSSSMIFSFTAMASTPSTSTGRSRNRGCKRKVAYTELDDNSLLDFMLSEQSDGMTIDTEGREAMEEDDDDDFRPNNRPMNMMTISAKRKKTIKDQKSTPLKKVKGPSRRNANSTKEAVSKKEQSSEKNSKKIGKEKSKHVKRVSFLKKKEMDSIVGILKKIELMTIINFVFEFLKKERHIEQNDRRKAILEDLKKTEAMGKLVSQLFSKCISLLKAGLSYNSKDRHAKYRTDYTFYVRDALGDGTSQVMKWFARRYFTDEDKNHYICVVNSIAVIVFQFVQQHVLSLKKKKLEEKSQSKQTTRKVTNSVLSLFTLAGGTFGKVYKCVKKSIKTLTRHPDKFKKAIKFRKFLYHMVMTPKEKKNPNIPCALKERDRGWLFIPKWIFLPYLRLLDRCIGLSVHQEGLKMYGKNLIKITSFNVENCEKLKLIFNNTVNYIKCNFAEDKSLFTENHTDTFFKRWQTKMVHSRVGQFVQMHYSMEASKDGKLVKGGASTRDNLFQVEMNSKKMKVKNNTKLV